MNRRIPFLLIRAAAVAVFLILRLAASVWDALSWYRALFWDDHWMKGLG